MFGILIDLLQNALQVHRKTSETSDVQWNLSIGSSAEKTHKKSLVDRAESCNYLMTNTVNKQTHDNEKENSVRTETSKELQLCLLN